MYLIIYGSSKGVRPKVRRTLMKRLTFLLIDVLGTSAKIDYLLVILRCVQLCDLRKEENTFPFESRCCKKSQARGFGAPPDFDFEFMEMFSKLSLFISLHHNLIEQVFK